MSLSLTDSIQKIHSGCVHRLIQGSTMSVCHLAPGESMEPPPLSVSRRWTQLLIWSFYLHKAHSLQPPASPLWFHSLPQVNSFPYSLCSFSKHCTIKLISQQVTKLPSAYVLLRLSTQHNRTQHTLSCAYSTQFVNDCSLPPQPLLHRTTLVGIFALFRVIALETLAPIWLEM